MNYIYKIFIALCFSFLISSGSKLFAQYDLGIYHLNLVPQTNLSNPAFMPSYQYHFGFPGLSSVYGGFGTSGAKYNQMFETTPQDSLALSPTNILANIKDGNNINSRAVDQWLNFGMRWQKFYFSASISDVTDVNAFYSKNLVDLAANGNGDFVGQTINLDPIAIKALHYREYAIGAAYDFNDQWNFGVKAKLLFGKSAINSEKMDITLNTTQDYYYINTTTDVLINTSLPYSKKDTTEDVSFGEYAFSSSNMGFGFDAGATFKLDDQWSFSASVLDLGLIKYDRWLNSYSSQASVSYKGIGVNQFDGLNEVQQEQLWQDIQDSIINLFEVNETVETFKVPLTAKIYLGANYQLSSVDNLGALVRLEIFKGVVRPSFTASYYRQLTENIGVTANYSILNRSYFNLGVGVVANYYPVQFYFVTDNVYGLIAPDDVRYNAFHFGINFIFPSHQVNRTMIEL